MMNEQQPTPFSIDEIKQIKALFSEYHLQQLEWKRKTAEIKLVAFPNTAHNTNPPTAKELDKATYNNPKPVQPNESVQSSDDEHYYALRSPIAGTFYRCSSPESPPFVQQGQQVSSGTTLCILEAMKVMNEIQSDIAGRIVKIVPRDVQAIQKGDILFLIDED